MQDPAGNRNDLSDDYTVIIDRTPPAKPVLTEVFDNIGDDTGALSAGDAIDDSHPDFKGTAEPFSSVFIYNNGELLGSAPVNERGEWAFTPELPMAAGHHDITVKAMDRAGNESEATDPFGFDIVAVPVITHRVDDQSNLMGDLAPGKPDKGGRGGIEFVEDNVGARQDNVENGGYTDDPVPEPGGGPTPGDTILIRDGGAIIGSAGVARTAAGGSR